MLLPSVHGSHFSLRHLPDFLQSPQRNDIPSFFLLPAGNEPNATVAYLSSLEGSREERAFELAKNEYLAWLEHKADRYTTVYGYMGLGDRYEQRSSSER